MGHPVLIGKHENNQLVLNSDLLLPIVSKLREDDFDKGCLIGVIGDYKGKSMLLNFIISYLSRDGGDGWFGGKEDLLPSGFPSGENYSTEGLQLWNEPFVLTSNHGEKIGILLMDTPSSMAGQKLSYEDTCSTTAFTINVSNIVIYITEENARIEETMELLHESIKANVEENKVKHFYVLVQNCKGGPFGKKGGEKYFQELKRNLPLTNTVFTSDHFEEISWYKIPTLFLDSQRPSWPQFWEPVNIGFVKSLKTFINNLLEPDDLAVDCDISATEMARQLEYSIQNFIRDQANSDYEMVDAGLEATEVEIGTMAYVTRHQEESRMLILELLSKSYNIYVELMQGLRVSHGTSSRVVKLEELNKTHDEGRQIAISKFRKECEVEPKLGQVDIYPYTMQLEEFIQSFKQYFTSGISNSSIVDKVKKGKSIMERLKVKCRNHKFKIPDGRDALVNKLERYSIFGVTRDLEEHPAIVSAFNAHSKNLSPNTAYLYLLGSSGTGKSSTINFLFGKKLLPTGSGNSVTKDTTEYEAPIKKCRLLIKNMKISIIDGPGLEDTGNKDTLHLACHRKFIDTHPQLRTVKPNIIMIIHNIMDERLGSEEETNSGFIRVLKSIRGAFTKKLLDSNRPSVIFVLTHLESVPKFEIHEYIQDKIQIVRKLSAKFLGIYNPPVVPVENYPERNYVVKTPHGWYKLRNGDKHPLTLFNELIQLCDRNEDYIGKEAISSYFSQAVVHDEIRRGHIVYGSTEMVSGNTALQNYVHRDSKIMLKLQQNLEIFPNNDKLPERAAHLVCQLLANRGIVEISMVPKGEEFLELFKNCPVVTEVLIDYAAMSLGVSISHNSPIDVKVGSSYDVFKDSFKDGSVFNLGKRVCKTWARLNVPEFVEIYEENKTLTRCLEFSSKETYLEKRWAELNVDVDLSQLKCLNLNNIKVRSGYSISNESQQSSSNKTVLLERHVLSVTAPDDVELSDGFKKALFRLPLKYEADNSAPWRTFLDRFGTHVVKTAWAGGSCTATISAATKNDEALQKFLFKLEGSLCGLASAGTGIGATNNSETEEHFSTATIEMQGGNSEFHCTSLQQMEGDRMKKWMTSIQTNPAVLTTTLNLISLKYIVAQHREDIAKEFANAYDAIVGTSVKSNSFHTERRDDIVLGATSRKDATEKTSPTIKAGFFQRMCSIL